TCSGGMDSAAVTAVASSLVSSKFDAFVVEYDPSQSALGQDQEDLAHARRMLDEVTNADMRIVPLSMDALIEREFMDSVIGAFDGSMPVDHRTFAVAGLYSGIHRAGHKVVLTGQGADELWMGYFHVPHYLFWTWGPEKLSTSYLAREYFGRRVPMGFQAWN